MIINFIDDLKMLTLPKSILEFENTLRGFKRKFFEEYKKIYIYSRFSQCDLHQLVYNSKRLAFSFSNIDIIIKKINYVSKKFEEEFPDFNPDFVIFFGFFSPDGFLMKINKKWYPTICLDRFYDLFKIEAIVAHELGHYFLKNSHIEYDINKEEIYANYLSTVILKTCYNNIIFSDGKIIPMISNEDRELLNKKIEYFKKNR